MKVLLILLVMGISCTGKKPVQLEMILQTPLPAYPSASSIVLYGERLYIMGDDAKYLLVLDEEYRTVDSIQLYQSDSVRIPKPVKADLESSAIITYAGRPYLILLGSGSTPKRDSLLLLDLDAHTIEHFSMQGLLRQLRTQVAEINMEGTTGYKDKVIISNRANTTNKQNQLIITRPHFFTGQATPLTLIPVELNTNAVAGISSLHYWPERDWLLFTATTEDTPSGYEDGAIGDSYLGIIKDFSQKQDAKLLSPGEWFNLSQEFPVLKQTKVEGLAMRASGDTVLLHLVSDNDNGESGLYTLRLKLADQTP